MSKEQILIGTIKESRDIIHPIHKRIFICTIHKLALLLKNGNAVGHISRCAKHVEEMSQWYNTVNSPEWSHQSINP